MKKKIIPVIEKSNYLSQVILGLDACTSKKQFLIVKKLVSKIDNITVLWNDSPEMLSLRLKLKKNGFNVLSGKGLNVWLMLNYWYATTQGTNVIMHDCDIKNYNERFLLSLALPIIDPRMKYDFVKLYYERITPVGLGKKLSGRVVRLLVTPLLDALKTIYGYELRTVRSYLDYLGMYKYCLSGEVGLSRQMASNFSIQPDWALEISTLSHLYDSPYNICQVDVGLYDHKHSSLSPSDSSEGLHKMSIDIVKSILRKIYDFGLLAIMDEDRFSTLLDYYQTNTTRLIKIYRDRSQATGLVYNTAEEEAAVETFAKSIKEAYKLFRKNPMSIKSLPSPHTTDSRIQQRLVHIASLYNLDLHKN